MKYLSVLLISAQAAFALDSKPGVISTLTADFFQEYKKDMMDIFEQACQTVDLEDQKLSHDVDLFLLTMQLMN